MVVVSASNPLWVVTCFFNPVPYQRRLFNFHVFRRFLKAPLLVVEHSHTGQFQLGPSDADILIQVRGGDVMWQKERLLNAGMDHLPPDCEYVAWIDCDTIFERKDWYQAAIAELQHRPLCQMFRTVYQLRRDAILDPISRDDSIVQFESIGYAFTYGLPTEIAPVNDGRTGLFKHGYAWCARRDLIQRLGLYDHNIVGSGDAAMSYAVSGQCEEYARHRNMTAAHAAGYIEWASLFRGQVQPAGHVDGTIFHLWHGNLARRKYSERFQILTAHNYDPDTDIALGPEGCWRWNSAKYDMHRAVLDYFHQRDEDGCSILSGIS
jgi:hypothetical protein